MKLKKLLISLLIILTGSAGLLFGCTSSKITLGVMYNETEISSIELKLPINSIFEEEDSGEEGEGEEEPAPEGDGEEPEEPNDETNEDSRENVTEDGKLIVDSDKTLFKVYAEKPNSLFKKGLDITYSENNIVKVALKQIEENAFVYEITALYPKNVTLTFSTKDKKVSTSLNVSVTQDLSKIEANILAKNYVVLGEDKEISTNIINFTPSTTTNRNIMFELVNEESYQGVSIINNKFVFTDNVVTLNGEKVNKLYINAIHQKYADSLDEDKSNFIIENIEFDILAPIGNLVAVVDGTSVDSLEFATNSINENLNYKAIEIKQKLKDVESFEAIDSSYEIKYYFKDDKNDVVSVERSGNTFVLSQNFRDDECTIVFYAQNKIQPTSEIKLKEISIVVRTHPSYITVNGERNPSEIVLYDNGMTKAIQIEIGPNNAYNQNFILKELNEEFLNLTYENGTQVTYNDIIPSGTTLLVSHSGASILESLYNTASLTLKSEVNENVEKTIVFRIVESLKYDEVKINGSLDINFNVPKIDILGNTQITQFTITATDNSLYIPNFNIFIENENIVTLHSLDNTSKTFALKSLTTGTCTVTIEFENGLNKALEITVYMPVNSFKIDIEDAYKTNLGEIIYEDGDLDSIALKINKTARLKIKAYDGAGNILNEKNIYTVNYSLQNNLQNEKECIAISNLDSIITALNETNKAITVTAVITTINQNGITENHTTTFDVIVYIPIDKVTISESYFSLYTKNDLGIDDENLSKAVINFKVEPSNATALTSSSTNYKKPNATLNFATTTVSFDATATGLTLNFDKNTPGATTNITNPSLTFIAKDLTTVQSYIGTISFSIQEYGIVYNKKATIKITKPITPQRVLLDNISTITDEDGDSEECLYFNLGYSSSLQLNPRVYPLDSYNLDYNVIISGQTTLGDPVKFDKTTGVITPVSAGECLISFIPKGVNNINKESATRTIKVIVADGSEAYPYEISSKAEFMALCSTDIVTDINSQNEKYTKHYRLTSDIDLNGENILPIGMYITKRENTSQNVYNFKEFTGSFNGEFKIGNVSKSCTISGINIVKDFGDLNSYMYNNEIKVGLFATNSGVIKNLSVLYNNIDIIGSSIVSIETSVQPGSRNANLSFYFGGIAGVNNKKIINCNVDIYSGNITTYFGKNNIGLIAGFNSNIKFVENAQEITPFVKESFVRGNLNVIDGVSKYNKDFNKTNTLRTLLVGGIVGKNDGDILDTFNIYNKKLEVFNKNKIASTITLTSVYGNDIIDADINSAFGLIAGENAGNIGGNYDYYTNTGLSSYGQVVAYNNVGGIAGKNSGKIENSFTASTIKGVNNVGGLIGLYNGGTLNNNAVMFLADNINTAKITGQDYVGGLIGSVGTLSTFTGTKNFVKSFVERENYYDIIVEGENANFGALFAGDDLLYSEEEGKLVANNCVLNNNFANFILKNNDKIIYYKGEIDGVGIVAPEDIKVLINKSTLNESTVYTYNKFIKADENSIVLYYYNNNSKLNEYLLNAILSQTPIYPSDTQEHQQLSLIQVESLNKEVLSTNDYGKIIVNKTGEAQIKIYSLLNEKACKFVNVKIINAITSLNLYLDSLSPSLKENQNKINESLLIEKEKSVNLYLDEFVKQENIYIEYSLSTQNSSMLEINAGASFETLDLGDGNIHKLYKTVNAQVIKGKISGTVNVIAKLYVKYFDYVSSTYKFAELPNQKEFNLNIQEGLKSLNSSVQNAVLVLNSSLDTLVTIETDLLTSTNINFKQYLNNEEVDFLKIFNEKSIANNTLQYNLKITLDKTKYNASLVNETIELKIYAYDSFVGLDSILSNEIVYSKYISTILIKIEENNLINLNMSYFADGEVIKDEFGNDVINTNELESNNIKIGKVGILKINVYPIENLTSLVVTFTNPDNLNLNFKQVRKVGSSYEDVNTSQIINRGIILDVSKVNIDENYVYLKLLTDSPIKEGSVFTIKAKINNLDYYFEKPLTSKLSTNLELSYKNAILNSNGVLEGVYAKGVQNEQIISLRVSKLNGEDRKEILTVVGDNSPNLKLFSEQKVSDEEHIYNFILENLTISGKNQYVELYFYIDKIVNNRTERYISNALKLNVVDFVVNSIDIENVVDGYLTKPYGTNYELKVKLNTTNNNDSAVLNKIAELEEKISKGITEKDGKNVQDNPWYKDNSKLNIGDYNDFTISKLNNYFVISPKSIFKGYSLSVNFAIEYKDGEVIYKPLQLQTSLFEAYIQNGNYSNKFRENFGLNFYLQTDINNPVPIYTQEDFVNMQQNANYILMNNLTLGETEENKYKIQNANFNSFDGNGYTITIKYLDIDISTSVSEFNFGLFGEISQNCQVKNLNIEFDFKFIDDSELVTAETINLLNINSLRFGALAGINNGLIYNCSVLPYKYNGSIEALKVNVSNNINGTQTTAYIGGLIGENGGIITNSRSELKLQTNKGFVAGFVSNNSGTISSSYYKNALITNYGEDETTSTTAGFVNVNTGFIKYSYVEGEEKTNLNGLLLSNALLSDYCITSSTSVGGFVYNNEGEIEDCYANLSITSQSFSGGFVYTNTNLITRCYSACLHEQDSDAHAPFIATKVSFNETEMKNLITNCFYLDANKSSINDNIVTKLSLKQMNDEYYLTNFVINFEDGVWVQRKNLTPTLIEANKIAFSQRRLYNSYVDGDGSTIYNYVYTQYYSGHESNPIIISNEEEFIKYFIVSSSKRNSYYYRIINNINFNEYSNLPTINYIFSGILDGNGLEINNLSISAPSNFKGDSFGLFSKIEKYNNGKNPVVKNLKITPKEVYANNVQKVGTLAGSIENSNIINITLDASGVIVQGRNIVGGLVGEVLGDSNIVNISSSLSVNASFANSEAGTYIYDMNEKADTRFKINELISYAGSICGVVNTNNSTNSNESIRNIIVNKDVKSIAEIAGLAFGLICDNSGVDNIKVNVSNKSYVNSLYTAGLVVGENRGYINRIETNFDSTVNEDTVLFKNTGFAIGGIVGFNNNGVIVNSIANAPVISDNNNTIVAGGVVGISVGGSISSVIATNKVYSNKIIGGVIGLTANYSMLTDLATNKEYYISLAPKDNMEYKENNNSIKQNNIIYISNTIALNKFNSENLQNKIVGAIIGGAHNSIDKSQENVSATLTVKNSYITNNNYFIPLKYEYSETIKGENITYTFNLKDYGAKNIQSISDIVEKDIFEDERVENEEAYCASKITIENSQKLFERFSSNIFANINNNIFNEKSIARDNIILNLLPVIKDINNINTKSLEGEGTYTNPYKVNSITSLNELANIIEGGKNEVYVNLTDNIEVTGKEINSIGANRYAFNGIFNGNNKFINGLTYINDTKKYSTQNFFGLFGVLDNNAYVSNLNIVANFVINYGSNVNYTGIIAGVNNGLITNCNVYGGIVGYLQNVNNNALSYVGGISGMNAGKSNTGIANCNNYSIIYVSVLSENETTKVLENTTIYAGFIAGANTNNAVINNCNNKAISNIDLNSGAGEYTLIVINSDNENSKNCKNYIGNMCGYSQNINNVFEGESKPGNIYSKALNTILFTGKVSS